ncbi:carboxypeptidase regulatory-like domain-containing protein [Vitiosangium sp. GDMCC 1.1324]|uniref:carboxypeptidase regulatory-like domain-containing protein n=1 Tax=Vitiosangium sp. (strain GDMCC 1.1324) TaxID=2138576 RepID=UPI00130EFD1B|nr:carboxypeptidase regulatory-like domain-containing protein [Vitiosangium sp. GDMCC 1.1324]
MSFVTGMAEQRVGVPDAECTLEGTDRRTVTDKQGYFHYGGLAAGSYILICKRATPEGTHAFLKPIEVPQAQDKAGNVDLGTLEITAAGSIEGVVRLAGQNEHTGLSVYIPGTSLQARSNAEGRWTLEGVPEGLYELGFEKEGYRPLRVKDVKVSSGARVRVQPLELNLTSGPSGSIILAENQLYSSSRTVSVGLQGSQDAALYMLSERTDFLGAAWRPMTPSTTWSFAADGEQRLYAKFADSQGLETAPVTDSIIVDTAPPSNARLLINSGAKVLTSRQVTLTVSAEDATSQVAEMKVSNDPALADASWEPFTVNRAWTLSDASSQTRVYVKLRDIVGNEMPEPVSAAATVVTGTPVSGTLPASSRWTATGNPYVVTDNVVVPVDGTLTIEPGVEVRFDGPYKLQVRGELVARGTAESRIVFTSNAALPQPGDWNGIVFDDSSTDAVLESSGEYVRGSVLAFTDIRYAIGIEIKHSAPLVADSHFHSNGSPTFSPGVLSLTDSAAMVRNNLIEQNVTRGLTVQGCGDAQVIGNTLQDNVNSAWGGGAIYLSGPWSCTAEGSGRGRALIENNRLLHNRTGVGGGGGALQVYGGVDFVIRHNEIRDNSTDSKMGAGAPASSTGTAISITNGHPVIEYNVIENNRSDANQSAAFYVISGSMTLQYNTVSNPTTYELFFSNPSQSLTLASNNYWGTTNEAAVRARVWDGEDDPEASSVTLTPLLSVPAPSAGPQ